MASINSLAGEIARALQEYTTEVEEGLEKVKVEVAKKTAETLKQTSPKLTGDYAKGWAIKKVGTAQVVHNRTNYQLTHLLEKGHAKRGGGRVSAIPHIAPAEELAIEEFESEVERVIRG